MFKLPVITTIALLALSVGAKSGSADAAGAWKTYKSHNAGFSISHPATWHASAHHQQDGSWLVTFRTPAGSGVSVLSRQAVPDDDTIVNQFNGPCRPIKAGTLSGARCVDTFSFIIDTTFVTSDRTYVISVPGKASQNAVYDRMIQSFRVIQRSAKGSH